MADVGVVVIGRNEGERLRRCLASVLGRGRAVVYVDSASTDGSPAAAASMGAEAVELDMSVPFSAARARNAGFDRLASVDPGVRYVQFVDGDCEMFDGWIDRAVREFEAKPKAAVVCGRLHERHPERSIYNRLADLEWDRPPGEVESSGGITMIRADALRAVGAFDPSVAAGEEPELCQRLREAGWKVYRLPDDMAWHDSAILRFRQWWKRSVRSGYGAMDVATRFRRGKEGLFVRQVHSARAWAIGYPVAVVAVAVFAGIVAGLTRGPATGVGVGLLAGAAVALALPLQMLRLAKRVRPRVDGWRTATWYGFLTMIGKWAHVVGQRQYRRDRAAGRNTRLIDYKAAGSPARPTSPARSSAAVVAP